MSAFHQPLSGFLQLRSKFCKHLLPCCMIHSIHAGIHTGHKNIGRTAGLIDTHKSFYFSHIYSVTTHMKNCRLCKGRKCFMKALDNNIRSKLCCRYRKIIWKMKMRSMCLIYNQRNSIFMYRTGNTFYVWYNSVIGRGRNQNCLYILIFFNISFHTRRWNSSVYPQSGIFMWINIYGMQVSYI